MLVQSETCLGYVVIIQKILIFHPTAAFGSNNDKILLRDIQTLTLKNGMMTNARRSILQEIVGFTRKIKLHFKKDSIISLTKINFLHESTQRDS